MTSDADDKERVRALLRSAFGYCSTERFSHDEYIELRRQVVSLTPEGRQRILPLVLEELLDTHTGDINRKEAAEFVLMQLNADMYVSKETEQAFAEIWGEESVARDREDREFRLEISKDDYSLFTPEQSRAVYEWLRLASTWADFRDERDDLEGALSYWKRRVDNQRRA